MCQACEADMKEDEVDDNGEVLRLTWQAQR